MNWLIPLTTLGATLIGILACLYLFVSVKRETATLRSRYKTRIAQLEETVAALSARLDEQSVEWKEAAEHASLYVPPPAPASGLNLTKRSQALKLNRLGEGPEHIAETLGIPQNEVDLLLRVQKIVVSSIGP